MSPKLFDFFVSVAILFAAAPALPQCDYRFQYSGQYRASILDLAVDNNDLWAASGYGVALYDRSVDPPKLVATAGLPGVTSIVRVANGIVYAAGTSGLSIIQRSGKTLQVVHTASIAGVNDLAAVPPLLFAATNNGILTFSAFDLGSRPFSLPTSSAAVYSLAPLGSLVYAVDGDSTIEVIGIFSGTSPQKLGTVATTLARPLFIAAIGTRLYVSDGVRTEVLTGSGATFTSLGTLPYATRTIAPLATNVVMIAGGDRQLRAIDARVVGNYSELFDAEVPPSGGGTINRVTALQSAGGRVYAASGDGGMSVFDVSRFSAPYPLHIYGTGGASSLVALPNAFFVPAIDGGILEMKRSPDGALLPGRTWDKTERSQVLDGSGSFLLTAVGPKLTMWFTDSTIPTVQSTATFAAPIKSAQLSGPTAIALLQDGTVWIADLSQVAPAPVRVAGGPFMQLADSASGAATTELTSDGTSTIVHYWSNQNFGGSAANFTVPGVATALAVQSGTAAVFTFRGITIINLADGSQRLLTGSNEGIVTALQINSGRVIALTQTGNVRVWDLLTGTRQRDFVVPGASAIMAVQDSTTVGIATLSGVATIDYGVAALQPAIAGMIGGNTYYKKAVANATHVYLFDGRVVDIYNVKSTSAPEWSASVLAAGTVDVAVSDKALFTLSNNEVVTEYSTDGVLLRSAPLNEGKDVATSGITTAAGAPWVSFSRGCTTATCEKRTDILDPQSLVRTAALQGGIVDVTTSGPHAYAIFDSPSEIRVYDVADPLHPSPLATRANDAGAVSIASNNGTVYALAEKAYAYPESSLTPAGTQLNAQKPGAFADVLIDSGCATIAGRSAAAETYALPSWAAGNALPVPGNIRSIVVSSGRLIILTDYSIEIWSRNPPPGPGKRRATAR
ncbi:MAG TPA: hypothetical protein VLU46_16450 [Thermoanaerobaculia bacterium]|nr:hypothetical protein [Thermoanaerobaculia bacterium]